MKRVAITLTILAAAFFALTAFPALLLRHDPELHHSIPGPLVDNPLPSPAPGITVSVSTIAMLDSVRKSPLQINLVRPVPGLTRKLLVNDIAGEIVLVDQATPGGKTVFSARAMLGDNFWYQGWEIGLLSFAIHPDFTAKGRPGFGRIYTTHSERPGRRWAVEVPYFGLGDQKPHHVSVVTEWRVDPQTLAFTAKSQRTLLVMEQPFYDHNLYYADFNPTVAPGDDDYGMLYLGVGNGGRGSYRERDRSALFGTILRIDPLDVTAGQTYGVPRDNPFSPDERRPEVWVEGLRNPQHFSWDSRTGKMYAVDIGEQNVEEVNLIEPGNHYGWSYLEGSFVLTASEKRDTIKRSWPPLSISPFVPPVAQYDHDDGNAIGSVFVYRGRQIPALYGMSVFSDIRSGRIFYSDPSSPDLPIREILINDGRREALSFGELIGRDRADLRLAEAYDGEILLLNKSDNTLRALSTPFPPKAPR